MPIIAVADAALVPAGVRHAPADPHAILDVAGPLTASGDVLLVARDRAGSLAARSARLAWGADRIGLLEHDVPATAFHVALDALHLLPEDALGLAPRVLAATAAATTTQVLLSSVSSLVTPAPSLADHARGLLPGTRFLVDWSAGTVAGATGLLPAPGIRAVVARSARRWDDVDTSSWPADVLEIEPDDASARWRAARWVEITAVRVALDSVVAGVTAPTAGPPVARCGSCDRPVGGDTCLFCGLAPAAATEVGPLPAPNPPAPVGGPA